MNPSCPDFKVRPYVADKVMGSFLKMSLSMKCSNGFTLAELLIALAILGVIATFTIPKVLQSQTNRQKTAVFKETIASLFQATEIGINDGTISSTSSDTEIWDFYSTHLNAVKLCTDAAAGNCWLAAQGDLPWDDTEGGLTLHNGAVIAGLGYSSGNTGRESVTIDWNGTSGPNTEGDDQLRVDMCFMGGATSGCFIDSDYEKNPYPSYQLGPFTGVSATLWGEIFTQ